MAGSDTSMNTLLWAMITLANNPKVQSSIREEIDSVVPRTRLPSLEDKPNLPYTEASMTEVMRWRTLAPFGIPRQTLRDTEVHGFHVPVGTQVSSAAGMRKPAAYYFLSRASIDELVCRIFSTGHSKPMERSHGFESLERTREVPTGKIPG